MELTVFWTEFAKSQLDDIFEYYKIKASVGIARHLVDSIVDRTLDLNKHPYVGAIEPFLQDRPQNFRFLVHKNYKIIYWVNERKKRVDIIHVFDTRQTPVKLNEIK